MWRIYRYTDGNGVQRHAYVSSSQEPAIKEIIKNAGGIASTIQLVSINDDLEELKADSRFPELEGAQALLDRNVNNPMDFPADSETGDTFADLAGMGATLRNFLEGQGISPGGAISTQAQNLLLPGAQAALGFGQGLNPADAENLNLTNLLNSGGLSGLASRSRNIWNQLAASGGAEAAMAGEEGSMQRPGTSGSELAGGTRNLALGALFERSPIIAAMFGRNAGNQASDRFFENQRAAQGSGRDTGARNMAQFMQDQIGANLFRNA